ncbi:hypothetical protein ILYODFUR_024179 [Ilyodon furcidens]|uniref:Uncharacterized protein n=1 Tax=Ilyodon furcidens TaxID=33524 RepID=A0ABV0UK26_9TELE
MEPPTPHLDRTNSPGKRCPASGKHPGRNNTNTPHHRHCNDSPGRNIIQFSCAIIAQQIQMLVTPHPRRGRNPPIPHAAAPPHHPLARRPDPPPRHDSHQSSTPPSPPNHPTSASSPSPSVHERETCTSRVTGPPATPVQAQDQPPYHQPQAGAWARGQSHRRKHWRKATTARQGPGTPPTPHPNPGGVPACQPPTLLHGTPRRTKQNGWPAPPPKRSHIPINTAHCPAKIGAAPTQPTDWAPEPLTEIQGNPSDLERAESSAPATDNPNPTPDPDQKACSLSQMANSERGCEKTPSLPFQPLSNTCPSIDLPLNLSIQFNPSLC